MTILPREIPFDSRVEREGLLLIVDVDLNPKKRSPFIGHFLPRNKHLFYRLFYLGSSLSKGWLSKFCLDLSYRQQDVVQGTKAFQQELAGFGQGQRCTCMHAANLVEILRPSR